MKNPEVDIPVLIIGGGPVGLLLAISLIKKGVDCRILEKRKDPVPDSRSLGIHPVSMELFEELGIAEPFLEAGLKIKKGLALTEQGTLGEISFQNCPEPYNYILACPQFTTEEILRDELRRLSPDALTTEANFELFNETNQFIETTFSTDLQSNQKIKSHFLVGCDGKNSSIRQQASIHYSGKRYDDTYIMGDFEDTTSFGSDAAVFLTNDGLIECFPLPNGKRRWVVKTDQYITEAHESAISDLIKQRIGYDLTNVKSTMLSSFGVQHFMAETFTKGRVLLAGDSAHVVSPIGGQGMNLGWLGCQSLANELDSALKTSNHSFTDYSINHRRVAKKVARRAEINMALGRKPKIPLLRNLFVKAMLKSPLKTKVAQVFTMRGLRDWWI